MEIKPSKPPDSQQWLNSDRQTSGQQPAEEALRSSEARLRAILQTAVEGIITIDEEGFIESFNPAAERTFGYSADEVIGKNVSMLMPPPYAQEHDDYLERYRNTGDARIIGIGREVSGRRKDGSIFPMDLAVSEVLLIDRRLFTGFVREITERKRTEERLLQAERLAAIGKAITGLAHESRNALARSQAALEMLIRRIQDRPDVVEFANRAQSAQDDLHRLYEEVREYASPIRLNREPCNLSEILHETWNDLQLRPSCKACSFREHRGEPGQRAAFNLTCQVDRFAIRQVFRNIIENSLAACDGPVEIEVVFTEAEIDDQTAVRVALRDNGPGLKPDERLRVFDEFYTTKTHGTGLGLAICKRLVEAHHGRIELGSSEQPGTEILITLPRQKT